MRGHPGRRHRALPVRRRFLVALLGLVGATFVVLGLHQPSSTPAVAEPPRSPLPTATTVAGSEPAVTEPETEPATATAPALPVRLSIPAIGVSKPLLELGVNRDKTVEVPSTADAGFPGWFRLGTPPGEVGSAVILGHVDSVRGPAVFYKLRFLVPGDRVDVRRSDGTLARFKVTDVVTYPNAEFPAQKVYASHGYEALNLVTCGGSYDPVSGYSANVVVYTRLVESKATPARSAG